VTTYADAIGAPGPDRRLPAWDDAPITPDEVREAAAEDMAEARSAEGSATDGEGAS
jgi:glucosyl-3-phosphoglycerate synthase